jgi:DNA-binding LytR/AlgR family response regulator
MKKLQTLIVDDEKPAVELLAAYAAKIPELEIAGTAQNALVARSILGERKIDLLLLDIQMPDLTGLELLKILKKPPAVILTTAYSEFALEGYELDIVDYLLKPIEFERFYRAVSKVLEIQPVPVFSSPTPPPADDYFFVKDGQQIVKVRFQEIYFIESMREYVRIHTSAGRVVGRLSLQKLEELLPRHSFFRIHRTYIVNIGHLRKIEGNLVFIGAEQLPVSKGKREEFLEFIRRKGLL